MGILNRRPFSFKVAQRIAKVYGRGLMTQNPQYPKCDPLASKGKIFDMTEWRYLGARHADRKLRKFEARQRTPRPKSARVSSSSAFGSSSGFSSRTSGSSTSASERHEYDESLQDEK